jgi:opacity protein-like surface antigen
MKRFIAVLGLAAAFSVIAVAGGTASNGKATPFKVSYSYTSVPGAQWTCSGARVVNKTTKESETCLISGDTTGFVAGTYSGNPTGNLPPLGATFQWSIHLGRCNRLACSSSGSRRALSRFLEPICDTRLEATTRPRSAPE